VAVDLDRIIAAPDESKMALHHVDRMRLALTANGHNLRRSTVPGRFLQPRRNYGVIGEP
jgi:hypothetical protein